MSGWTLADVDALSPNQYEALVDWLNGDEDAD
jgi:hypothetical protein